MEQNCLLLRQSSDRGQLKKYIYIYLYTDTRVLVFCVGFLKKKIESTVSNTGKTLCLAVTDKGSPNDWQLLLTETARLLPGDLGFNKLDSF